MAYKIGRILFFCAALTTLGVALYRDFTIGPVYTIDLRNRVVGARLMHDGISPYYYKWKTGDPIRYYDPFNFSDYKVSRMTASPFFHLLMEPLAELPQWKIQYWWIAIHYLLLLTMVYFSLALAHTRKGKITVLVFALLFLHTDAWKFSILSGQNYLVKPFLAMCVYFVLVRMPKTVVWAAVAGAFSIIFVLVRPNALIFFLPAFFLLRDFGRARLIAFFIPVLLLTGWTLADSWQRSLWKDYYVNIGEQEKIHHRLHPAVQVNDPDPGYLDWEGMHGPRINPFEYDLPMHIHTEMGNVFWLVFVIFKWDMPIPFLLSALAVVLVILMTLYYLNARRFQSIRPVVFDPATTLIFGYCLYMIADLFSPITRNQYYTV
ncbi:MAG TPA: glycosyltransferase family 87 protein, partial [Puia sp.]|nr:glycosyltransferase family 87 protein [Puia sp.]